MARNPSEKSVLYQNIYKAFPDAKRLYQVYRDYMDTDPYGTSALFHAETARVIEDIPINGASVILGFIELTEKNERRRAEEIVTMSMVQELYGKIDSLSNRLSSVQSTVDYQLRGFSMRDLRQRLTKAETQLIGMDNVVESLENLGRRLMIIEGAVTEQDDRIISLENRVEDLQEWRHS